MKNYAKLQKVFELPKLLTIFNINIIYAHLHSHYILLSIGKHSQ